MADFAFFGATAADVLTRLKGTVLKDFDTDVGADDGVTVILGYMNETERLIFSILPDEIQRKLTRIEGEVLIRKARDGDSTATLGITDSPTSLLLYKNPTGRLRDLDDNDEMPTAEYSHDGSGVITFSPALTRGDMILATYDHAKTSFDLLMDLLLDITAHKCSLLQSQDGDTAYAEVTRENREFAFGLLKALSNENGEFVATMKEFSDMAFYEGDVHRKRKQILQSGRINLA